jgi:hypothetical protein
MGAGWVTEAKQQIFSGSVTNATNIYTSEIDLTGYAGAKVSIKFDGDNPTNDLIVEIQAHIEAFTAGDHKPIYKREYENDGTEDYETIDITPAHGAGIYRIRLQSTGAVTTFTVLVEMRRYK